MGCSCSGWKGSDVTIMVGRTFVSLVLRAVCFLYLYVYLNFEQFCSCQKGSPYYRVTTTNIVMLSKDPSLRMRCTCVLHCMRLEMYTYCTSVDRIPWFAQSPLPARSRSMCGFANPPDPDESRRATSLPAARALVQCSAA
jgi:hypothetical protein